jgi:DNA-binding MarR family transcriptional regulator/GNAT superfamily N-acetyltransferase
MEHTAIPAADVAKLRSFNRIYTSRLGLLNEQLDGSPFPLTEARVLYELAHRDRPTAAEVGRALSLDKAQLSRILKRFGQDGLVDSVASPAHGKHRLLALTDAGKAAFAGLDQQTQATVAALLAELPNPWRRQLLSAAGTMADVLAAETPIKNGFKLRDLRVGDLGWVTHRQAVLYGEEYDWDLSYEALVAEILANFVRDFDPVREQGWIADVDDTVAGSIFLMKSPDPSIGKLRLLYVEPSARGLGIGRILVDACISQARASGYARLELWTNSVLVSARRIYEAVGFQLMDEAPHRSFGHDLVGQTWGMNL